MEVKVKEFKGKLVEMKEVGNGVYDVKIRVGLDNITMEIQFRGIKMEEIEVIG